MEEEQNSVETTCGRELLSSLEQIKEWLIANGHSEFEPSRRGKGIDKIVYHVIIERNDTRRLNMMFLNYSDGSNTVMIDEEPVLDDSKDSKRIGEEIRDCKHLYAYYDGNGEPKGLDGLIDANTLKRAVNYLYGLNPKKIESVRAKTARECSAAIGSRERN
jgi:hypothetical protein